MPWTLRQEICCLSEIALLHISTSLSSQKLRRWLPSWASHPKSYRQHFPCRLQHSRSRSHWQRSSSIEPRILYIFIYLLTLHLDNLDVQINLSKMRNYLVVIWFRTGVVWLCLTVHWRNFTSACMIAPGLRETFIWGSPRWRRLARFQQALHSEMVRDVKIWFWVSKYYIFPIYLI